VSGITAAIPAGTVPAGGSQVAGAHAASGTQNGTGSSPTAPATPRRHNPSCAQTAAFGQTPELQLTSYPVAAGLLPSSGLGLILGILAGLAILAVGSGMRSVISSR
jgi:hypothetical protein